MASDGAAATPLPLPPYGGAEQYVNAAACAQVVECLSPALPVPRAALAAGIRNAYLRGRLERHDLDGTEWVLDVAHNPAAAAGLVAALARLPAAARTYVVFAAMRDKDLSGVVAPFVPAATGWFVAQASADRGATAAELELLLASVSARNVVVATTIEAAVAAARAAAEPGDRVVVYGSFYTVGAAMETLRLYCAASPLVDRPTTWIRD
jgi:dihydrofolate synthase/folylpolyglutamate synthase